MDIDVVATPILSGLRVEYVAVGEWTELAACTICGESGTLREVASVHAREPAASFAACVECQFIFCSRRPRSSWFESFYAASWDERGRRGIDEAHAEFSGADFCRPHLAPRARVLDIGAGLGHAALGFRDQGTMSA